ncbi:MAG: DUF4390 domain-containing protein [Gammaproteobacteria bacterium]|nr:DUF4390 domain-containing protein [Gammaproteobacteria bacterium]
MFGEEILTPGGMQSLCAGLRSRARLLQWALVGLCLSANAIAAAPAHFVVRDAKTVLSGEIYHLEARLEYQLSEVAVAALENGVSLTLVLDIEVYSPSRYLWDDVIATLEQRYEIQYHALSEQYLLRNLNSGSQFIYSSLDDALDAMGNINRIPILDAHLLEQNQRYKVRVRSRLDLPSLPVPLQLKAYVSSDWWLSSGWYSWDL